MNEELELDLDAIEADAQKKVEVKNRYQQLSEKVFLTAKERDEATEAKKKIEEERDLLSKERDFYKSFSQISSKHPEATQYQDQILERVNKGYDPEEAVLAVLAKEGKLGVQAQPDITRQRQVEGGSAATNLEVDKSVSSLSMEEKFNKLKEIEKSEDVFGVLQSLRM